MLKHLAIQEQAYNFNERCKCPQKQLKSLFSCSKSNEPHSSCAINVNVEYIVVFQRKALNQHAERPIGFQEFDTSEAEEHFVNIRGCAELKRP